MGRLHRWGAIYLEYKWLLALYITPMCRPYGQSKHPAPSRSDEIVSTSTEIQARVLTTPCQAGHCATTRSYDWPRMEVPRMEALTLCRNMSRFWRSSFAASEVGGRVSQRSTERGMQCDTPLLRGSSALGSRNRYCRPTITELRFSTGFQSSRRMFRQTFPSRSTFGW